MHVLVHYLFTNTYQCLRSKGTTKHEKATTEFVTAVRAYALSRKYEISSLEELAGVEMQKLSNMLHFSVVFSLVQGAYPAADAEDSWFSSFLKTRLTLLLLHPSESECEISNAERKTLSLSDLLLKCSRELAESQCLRIQDPDAASKAGVTEDFTFRTPIPQLGLQGSPRAPFSDTEVSCGLELTELELPEHESELGYGSPTYAPDAEPVKPEAELAEPAEPEAELAEPVEPEAEPVEPKAEPVKPEAELAEPVESEAEPAPVIKKKKTKKMKKAEEAKAKKAKKAKKAAEEESTLDSVKAKEPDEAPAAADEWSLCGSEGREIHRDCGLRAKHVLEGGWKECGSCRFFVDRLHQELAE